jgi:hypothetical protein
MMMRGLAYYQQAEPFIERLSAWLRFEYVQNKRSALAFGPRDDLSHHPGTDTLRLMPWCNT